MALEQYYDQEGESIPSASTSEDLNGSFDCNICLDFAIEPIVTLCGHLYCWPCIYKWLLVQSASLASDEPPRCPVCKADISHTTMVPLYGRGQSEPKLQHKARCSGVVIPPRPPACGSRALWSTSSPTGQQLPYRNPYQNQNYNHHEEGSTSPLNNLGGSNPTGFHHPVIGLFREMLYFGNSESLHTYQNSNRPRLRRREMQAERSLNRISIFLFLCFLLCLIVF